MSRINYPGDFPSRNALLLAVKAKHDADGAASPLLPYLAEHGIDMNALALGSGQALIHHTSSGLLRRQAENHSELRDTRFNPVFTRVKGMVQFLKSLYKGNPKALGDWAVTVDGQSRVVYPASFTERAALFSTFAARHDSFGAGLSPLQPYLTRHGIDLGADAAVVAQAAQNHAAFGAASKDSEAETAQRNNLHDPVMAVLRGIGDFLKKLYDDNAKALGAWGFTVDDSPRAPKLRTTSLKIGESKTITSVSIGGTFSNTGITDLHLYRGKTTNGTPVIVHPGEQAGMVKGFSIITVVNPSSLSAGKFTVLINHA